MKPKAFLLSFLTTLAISLLTIGSLACGGASSEGTAEADETHDERAATHDDEASDEPVDAPSETVTTKRTRYQIQYPAGWALMETPPHGVDTLARSPHDGDNDAFQENMNVVVEKLPQAMTTPEFAMATTAGMQQLIKGFELISTNEVRLEDGTQAIEAVYKSHFQSELHHIATMLADKSDHGYVITGTASPDAFADYAPRFRQSAKSFTLKK